MFRRGGLSPAAFVGKASSGTAAASSAGAMASPPLQAGKVVSILKSGGCLRS
jgi:hypothetical protein